MVLPGRMRLQTMAGPKCTYQTYGRISSDGAGDAEVQWLGPDIVLTHYPTTMAPCILIVMIFPCRVLDGDWNSLEFAYSGGTLCIQAGAVARRVIVHWEGQTPGEVCIYRPRDLGTR